MCQSRMRLDSRAQNQRRSSDSGAGAQVGPPVTSWRRPQPSTARPHSPVDPVLPLPAGNASHAALHRVRSSRPSRTHFRGRSRPPGGSVSVVSRLLRRDQARKRPRLGNSPPVEQRSPEEASSFLRNGSLELSVWFWEPWPG